MLKQRSNLSHSQTTKNCLSYLFYFSRYAFVTLIFVRGRRGPNSWQRSVTKLYTLLSHMFNCICDLYQLKAKVKNMLVRRAPSGLGQRASELLAGEGARS